MVIAFFIVLVRIYYHQGIAFISWNDLDTIVIFQFIQRNSFLVRQTLLFLYTFNCSQYLIFNLSLFLSTCLLQIINCEVCCCNELKNSFIWMRQSIVFAFCKNFELIFC